MNASHHTPAGSGSAPDNLIENPLDKPKREQDRSRDKQKRKPGDPGDNLITNPLDKPDAGDKLIQNPLDKR